MSSELEAYQKTTSPGQDDGKGSEEVSAEAERTKQQVERDEKRSRYCNTVGNVLMGVLLSAYIVYAFVIFAIPHFNQTTTVSYAVTDTLTFPTIFFQLAEYGVLENISVVTYYENCKIHDATNASHNSYVILHNPSVSALQNSTEHWIIANTTYSYYNYSQHKGSTKSRRRQLLSETTEAPDNSSYEFYFQNYTNSDYYSSAASNYYYVFPPTEPKAFTINTNRPARCGDVVELHFVASVPKEAFVGANINGRFMTNLYVRSYPDSFGIQYGYDSRTAVLDSIDAKDHVYYTGRLSFGEIKTEVVQLTTYQDLVSNGNSQEFYQSLATIDFTNLNYNLSTVRDSRVYFDSYLYIYANNFLIEYETIQLEGWTDVLSAIGGMQSTFSDPIAFIIALWLYGVSLACLQFEGKAPLDPLPDDFVKRLDVYIADKVFKEKLLPGPAWAAAHQKHEEESTGCC